MANWNNPVVTDLKSNLLDLLKERDVQAAKMDYTGDSNIPTSAKRWSSANNRFENWNGSAWVVLTTTYSINVDSFGGQNSAYYRNAANINAGTLDAARLTGTYSININGNANFATTAGSASSATTAATAGNAGLFNGNNAAFYQNAANLNAGFLPLARLSGTYNISINGNAATATSATTAGSTINLNGQAATYYLELGNHTANIVPLIDGADLLAENDKVLVVQGSAVRAIEYRDLASVAITYNTSRTLTFSDANRILRHDETNNRTWTVPPNSSVAFRVGCSIVLANLDTGLITLQAGSGVVINSVEDLRTISAKGTAVLMKVSTNEWQLIGNLQ